MIGAHHHAKNSHKDRKEWRLVTVQEGMNLVDCSNSQQNCWTDYMDPCRIHILKCQRIKEKKKKCVSQGIKEKKKTVLKDEKEREKATF